MPDSRTLLVFTKTLRVHIPISTPVRGVSWCVANPIDALDLPNASPTFMLPNLPRMMFYLDLVRRGKKTFVTLQVRAFCTEAGQNLSTVSTVRFMLGKYYRCIDSHTIYYEINELNIY